MPPSFSPPAYTSLGHLMRTSMAPPCVALGREGRGAGRAGHVPMGQRIYPGSKADANKKGGARAAQASPAATSRQLCCASLHPCAQPRAPPKPTCSRAAASACTACTTASDTMYCTKGRRCPGMASRCTAENMRQPSGDSHVLPLRPAMDSQRKGVEVLPMLTHMVANGTG